MLLHWWQNLACWESTCRSSAQVFSETVTRSIPHQGASGAISDFAAVDAAGQRLQSQGLNLLFFVNAVQDQLMLALQVAAAAAAAAARPLALVREKQCQVLQRAVGHLGSV